MTLKEIITHPEGRRLEFKEAVPEHADLAKTIIAFANDAGGELWVGLRETKKVNGTFYQAMPRQNNMS
jgi:predicted HTH transcriptional regulator